MIATIDPVTQSLIRSSLLYASEEMGIALRNSSFSPNIKERMDHSAALFDSEGRLLAQAEHIPVHLGSLPWGMKNLLEYCKEEGVILEEDSMLITNNPYVAGTHLNDITVVKPIFHNHSLIAFAANKAHHSDVGGKVPGSISVDARSIYEEGMIINPTYLVRHGEFVTEVFSIIEANSRTATERKGDLRAQAAANTTGERRLLEIVEKDTLTSFTEASRESFEYAEKMMKTRLASLGEGRYNGIDFLEHPDGHDITLKVSIDISSEGIDFDYSGTDAQVPIPINAVFGVTLSGVYYVMRTITGDDIPANHGSFSSFKVTVPSGTILNPRFPHPVAIGNVETSQRNADLLYRALSKALPKRIPAASGGSMNNVMMGGIDGQKSWAFYETIGVGLGGRMSMDGIDGIQANMTNTMNTPIEEIERSLPVLITRYEFRENSCGAGRFRGGCGIVRAFEMLGSETTFTVVSERVRHEPWGLRGGSGGAKTEIKFSGGKTKDRTKLEGKETLVLHAHDVVEIHTAGGGGYESPRKRLRSSIREDLKDGLITKKYVAKYF
ncbi:MAG: hydantoinase B/oxoprolinase family protein [Nitrososphaerales archaeon]